MNFLKKVSHDQLQQKESRPRTGTCIYMYHAFQFKFFILAAPVNTTYQSCSWFFISILKIRYEANKKNVGQSIYKYEQKIKVQQIKRV